MQQGSSLTWRKDGDNQAFDSGTWEFKARQFRSSAEFLLRSFDSSIENLTFETMMLLPSAEFMLALSIELMSKAHYLKNTKKPKEDIYKHEVSVLFEPGFLSPEQLTLLHHSERYVVWAGRYPTPKWTKEKYKEDYDVPSLLNSNHETIDARDIPNTASRPRCNELIELYEFIHSDWVRADALYLSKHRKEE
jgi:hypothetical protein